VNRFDPHGARLRLLAVDDEVPALEDLVRMLRASPAVGEVEAAASAAEALVALGDEPAFDALFLDVRMPGLDGLELARVLRRFERPPAVVFVSAFDDFAVDAFELAALDYLVKPVSRRRLDEAIERVARVASGPSAEASAAADDEMLPVDALRGGATRLLPRSSVLFLQAHGDYVRVASTEGRYLVRARLSDLEERWAGHGFVRVHRGFVVNLRRAVEVRPRLNGTAVLEMADGTEVPIARRQVGELRRKLGV
jgi:DNA-binding LytR/AlgR family response regulator